VVAFGVFGFMDYPFGLAVADLPSLDLMNITSRYSDNPKVIIDVTKVPEEFRHLLPLAKEWSISDDGELDAYIDAAPDEKKRELVDAFSPYFDALWKWHQSCDGLVPQPDEIVLFDTAANAAGTVISMLS
jgi:hypothetical protein